MKNNELRERINVLFVCDFASIHARSYVAYFAARRQEFEVTVATTRSAPEMDGVRLFPLCEATGPSRLRAGRLGILAYGLSLRLPRLYGKWRGREDLRAIDRMAEQMQFVARKVAPDVIHAHRTVPEGALALRAKAALPNTPLFLTTWGQDFVCWTKLGRRVEEETRRVVEAVDVLLPDNPRDGRLASECFGLGKMSKIHVMPAPGGIDFDSLKSLAPDNVEPPPLDGSPRLLAVRGYENLYVQVRVLLEAIVLVRERFPNVHLYLDGPRGHAGERATQRWIAELGLQRNVTVVHLDRRDLMGYMRACDLYVSATVTDGLPMSLLEAYYFGLVPVVRDHESTRAVVREFPDTVTFDKSDAAEIAGAWETATGAIAGRPARIARNRDILRRQYERESNLNRAAALYREAVVDLDGASPGGSSCDL